MSDEERADDAADESVREATESVQQTGEARAAAERVHEAAEAMHGSEGADHEERVKDFVEAAATAVKEAREAERQSDQAADAAERAGDAALEVMDDDDAHDDPLLDTAIRQIEAGATEDQPFGMPGEPIAERSPFRVAFAATWGVLVALLIAHAAQLVQDVIILVVVSAFLAIGLHPAVESLRRRGMKRGFAVATIIGAVLLFFGGFVAAAAPPVAKQASQLRERIPQYTTQLRENPTFRKLDDDYHITPKIKAYVEKQGTAVAGSAVSAATTLLGLVFKTLTVLILTLYFLGSYPKIKHGAYRLIPRSRRARAGLIADEILARVGGYVLGNLATSFIAGVCAAVFFLIAGVPYPVALAMLVAILDLIPLVGATIAAVVCTAVAFFVSVPVGVASTIYFVVYQQVENYVLVPKVMKRTVDISPLATIIAALIGGSLLGILGALLAIPVAAAIQLIGTEVLYPRQDTA
jgi:predicted PurR-regulated permease PerM